MAQQEIYSKEFDVSYGIRGESTGVFAFKNGKQGRVHEVRVGDAVCYNDSEGNAFCGIVMKWNGKYGIMGRGVNHLNFDNITITVPYERVPIEMINALHGGGFEYKEVEVIEMTIEDIEELVGKRVKIVKEER